MDDEPLPANAAAVYLRRSADNCREANRSLREQRDETLAFAAREGFAVVRVFEEQEGVGASPRSRRKRPAWDAALESLLEGDAFRTLILHSQSRADRRGAGHIARLIDELALADRRIVSLDGMDTADPSQRMRMILRAEMDLEESERIASRVARTKGYRRANGEWLGGRPPWGTRVGEGRRLEHDPETYPTARRIADLLLSGDSLWEVCRTLNSEGHPGPTGKGWRTSTLQAIVRSPGWAGLQGVRRRNERGSYDFTAEVFRGEGDQEVSLGAGVITSLERGLILAQLSDRAAFGRRRPRGERSGGGAPARSRPLLADVLACPACGGRSTIAGRRDARVYRCANAAQGGARCSGFSAPQQSLDHFVIQRVRGVLGQLDVDSPLSASIAAAWMAPSPDVSLQVLDAEIVVADAEAADQRVKALALIGALTPAEAAMERRRTLAQLVSAKAELNSLRQRVDAEPVLDLSTAVRTAEALAPDTQRRLLASIVESVVVSAAGRRGVRFKPDERVTITMKTPE